MGRTGYWDVVMSLILVHDTEARGLEIWCGMEADGHYIHYFPLCADVPGL